MPPRCLTIRRPEPGSPLGYVLLRRGVQAPGAGPPQAATLMEATGPSLAAFGLSRAARRPVSAWLGATGAKALDGGPRRWGGLDGRLFLTGSASGDFGD